MGETCYDNTKALVFIENKSVVSKVDGDLWNDDETISPNIDEDSPILRVRRTCLSDEDGIEIVRNKDTSYNPLKTFSIPLRGVIRSRGSVFKNKKNVIHLKGITFISSCWRKTYNTSHPTHFIMGIGPIINYLYDRNNGPFDNIILHQCSHLDNKFFSFLMKIFKRLFIDRFGDRPLNVFILPFKHHHDVKYISCDEGIIPKKPFDARLCIFGSNLHKRILQEARNLLKLKLPPDYPSPLSSRKTGVTIGILVRSGSNSGNRCFKNLKEVINLAGEFTSNVSTFTTNEKMDLKEQIELFNSFDIIITPHSSSMVMTTFNSNKRHVAIEIVFKKYNDHCQSMSVGIDKYIISPGHLFSGRGGYDINMDIHVNLVTLKNLLTVSIDYLSGK